MNFPFICSKLPVVHAYGVYISHLIVYSGACGSYHNALNKGLLLPKNLLNKRLIVVKLKSSILHIYQIKQTGFKLSRWCNVSVLAWGVVDHRFEPQFGQTKVY